VYRGWYLSISPWLHAFRLSLSLSFSVLPKTSTDPVKKKIISTVRAICFSAGNVFDSSDNNLMSHLSFVAQNEMGGVNLSNILLKSICKKLASN